MGWILTGGSVAKVRVGGNSFTNRGLLGHFASFGAGLLSDKMAITIN